VTASSSAPVALSGAAGVAAILLGTAAHIRKHGVHKGEYQDPGNRNRLDLLATMHYVAGFGVPEGDNPLQVPVWLTANYGLDHPLRFAIAQVLGAIQDDVSWPDRVEAVNRITMPPRADSILGGQYDRAVIATWNDLRGTKKHNVLAALDRAIRDLTNDKLEAA
jgi:hypothetical protein